MSSAPNRAARKDQPHRRRRRRFLLHTLVVVAVAVAVAVLLRVAVVQPFSVPSTAMVPTLQAGDRILVVRPTLLTGPVHRGDIIVFHRPSFYPCGPGTAVGADLVKRVIGLPGETIWSVGDSIDINGRPLDEPAWRNPTGGPVGSTPIRRTQIPAGHYFVMGDNRTDSCDSRSFGAISGSSIVGKVVVIVSRAGHPYFHFL